MKHEPKKFIPTVIANNSPVQKCIYCGINLYYNRNLIKYEPKFTVNCLTEEEW